MTIHNKYVTDALLSTIVHLTIEASVTADAQNVCPLLRQVKRCPGEWSFKIGKIGKTPCAKSGILQLSSEYNEPCAAGHCHTTGRALSHHRQEDRDTSCSHKTHITLGLPSETSFPSGSPQGTTAIVLLLRICLNRITVNPRALFFVYQQDLKFQRVYRS